jgi:hypothetical protein
MYRDAAKAKVPLATAFVHLHNPLLTRLRGSMVKRITWKGPDSSYGTAGRLPLSCPAELEWGAHAWAMARYLGAREDVVATGHADQRVTLVETDAGTYAGQYDVTLLREPLQLMLKNFARWLAGEADSRFEPKLALWVDDRCRRPGDYMRLKEQVYEEMFAELLRFRDAWFLDHYEYLSVWFGDEDRYQSDPED